MEISTLSIIFLHANISDKWKRGQLSLEQMKKKGKVKVKSWIRYLAACSIQKMRWDIWRIFFQTLEASFPYKGVFFTKVVNANIIAFRKAKILRPVSSVKHTPSRFLNFIPSEISICNFIFSFFNFWGGKRASSKKIMNWMKIGREINFQSWTFRNSFSSNGSPCCIVHWPRSHSTNGR